MYKDRNLCLSCKAEVGSPRDFTEQAGHLLAFSSAVPGLDGSPGSPPAGKPWEVPLPGARSRGHGSLYPLPAASPPACQAGCWGGRQASFQNVLGRKDAIPHRPGFWEDLIKTDVYPVCFNARVLAFAMPDKHARKFPTSCTTNTERQQLSALAQSILPLSSQRSLGSKPTCLDSNIPTACSTDFFRRGQRNAGAHGKPVRVPEGWTPGQGVQRRDVARQPLLYACSSR